jgi:hypothetical protein
MGSSLTENRSIRAGRGHTFSTVVTSSFTAISSTFPALIANFQSLLSQVQTSMQAASTPGSKSASA